MPQALLMSPSSVFFHEISPLTEVTCPLACAIFAIRSWAEIAGRSAERAGAGHRYHPATSAIATMTAMITYRVTLDLIEIPPGDGC